MTRFSILVVIVAFQLVFVVLTLVLLFVTRLRGSRSRARSVDASALLEGPLQRIMLGDDNGEAVAAALSQLPARTATRELMAMGGARLAPEQRAALAALVRPMPWVEHTLAQAASRNWWARMEAARLLVMVCDHRDEQLVARLVTDANPAVASAATTAIATCASAALVEIVVNDLPSRSGSVRLQQCNALRAHAALATAALVPRLSGAASVPQLRAWTQLAEVLATPNALAAAVPLASHSDVDVRTGVARALRHCFSREGADAVTRLLRDENWRVRAAAARAAGALNVKDAIPLLTACMHDESWWVRFRAGLALADLSQEGRFALDATRRSADPFARDMATLICGLSDGSRLDLTSA